VHQIGEEIMEGEMDATFIIKSVFDMMLVILLATATMKTFTGDVAVHTEAVIKFFKEDRDATSRTVNK